MGQPATESRKLGFQSNSGHSSKSSTAKGSPSTSSKITRVSHQLLAGKPKLILTSEAFLKILYLCQRINYTEWSGMLFYTTEGSFDKIDETIITVRDIYLRDIGSSTYTEFDNDEGVMKVYEKTERMQWRAGLIHSHHNMQAFFSGTDMDELGDNSIGIDYYVSLIVNNKSYKDWKAKIAIRAEEEVVTNTKSKFHKAFEGIFKPKKQIKITRDILYTYDLEIDIEAGEALEEIILNTNEVADEVKKRQDSIKHKAAKYPWDKSGNGGYQTQLDLDLEDENVPVVDEASDHIFAAIIYGNAKVVNTFIDAIAKMARHLDEKHYKEYAKKKFEGAPAVIRDCFEEDLTDDFVLETMFDFVKALQETVGNEFDWVSPEADLVYEMITAFNIGAEVKGDF